MSRTCAKREAAPVSDAPLIRTLIISGATSVPSGKPEVVVIGAGIMGLAAARALAQAGGTLVFEQDAVGTPRGSSHGSSRIFRLL